MVANETAAVCGFIVNSNTVERQNVSVYFSNMVCSETNKQITYHRYRQKTESGRVYVKMLAVSGRITAQLLSSLIILTSLECCFILFWRQESHVAQAWPGSCYVAKNGFELLILLCPGHHTWTLYVYLYNK